MRKIVVCFLLVVLLGCESQKKPKNLLSEEEMIDVLYDLTLYQSMKNYNFNKDTLVLNGTIDEMLKKHGIDSATFVEQNDYYLRDMKRYAHLYDEVAERLKKELEHKKELNKERQQNNEIFNEELKVE